MYNNQCEQIIQIPNLLLSLTKLYNYKPNIHINNEQDQQSIQIREKSRECLSEIQSQGDEQAQTELINVGLSKALIIRINSAGGTEDQGDKEIEQGLQFIFEILNQLNKGKNNYYDFYPSFPAQPDLSQSYIEQVEEEGGIEEPKDKY
ncbi:MAG: hypothetical protein EZS28_055933 [Streblomastix strix]|uniref:Uncharacterized protein n=1 Tax=Streblomastix strix TaxID=222440 RepID=A0A5J4PSF9_9EUKA|nr:MAG: hypothetical protein EZS28_055933 [Streblomastix strix]